MIAIFTFINIVDACNQSDIKMRRTTMKCCLIYFILFINKIIRWKHLKEQMSCILKIKMNIVKNKSSEIIKHV